jgi:hypothetical protein
MLHLKKIAVAVSAALLAAGPVVNANADELGDLKAQVDELQKKVRELDSAVGSAPKNFKLLTAGDEDGTFKLPGSETSVGLYGFIHVDAFKDAKGRSGDWAMEPGSIPIQGDPSGINADTRKGKFNLTAQTSRFGIKTATPTDMGILRTKLEMDFYTYGALKSGYTNSYNPRLRHGYGELAGDWGTLLIGQTWSTFMNLDALPETVDFNGHGSAQLARQAMVRYTSDLGAAGSLSFAAEDSATMLGSSPQANPSIDKRPDAIVAWNKSGDFGSAGIQLISAAFSYDDNAGTKADKNGTGYSVGGMLKVGARDTLQGNYTGGKGISRYVPSANYNGEAFVGGEIKLAKVAAYTLGWAHAWTDAVRTNLSYGLTKIDDDYKTVSANANEQIKLAFGNVFWGITKNTEFGFEYAAGQRRLFSGESGSYSRVQASAHYSF